MVGEDDTVCVDSGVVGPGVGGRVCDAQVEVLSWGKGVIIMDDPETVEITRKWA